MSNPDPIRQFNNWMRNNLRREFFKFWERTAIIKESRVDRGLYKCAGCKLIMKIKGMHVDHIEPVVDPKIGFIDWDIYIRRLFCSKSNLQLLCKDCHDKKTTKEREERKQSQTGVYSPDRAAKISAAKLGRPNIKIRRKVVGRFGLQEREFGSTKEAAEALHIPRRRITDVLIGRRTQVEGWTFRYWDPESPAS